MKSTVAWHVNIPPRDAHEPVGAVEATVCLLKGRGTVYRTENPAFCKNRLHRSQLEHISRPRTVRYLAVETYEEAMPGLTGFGKVLYRHQ
jgi:hypothetical protein